MKEVASSQAPTLVSVLDSKRCRNACIALARIRVPFEEIRRRFVNHIAQDNFPRISLLDYHAFTPDQITILMVAILLISFTV